MLAVLAMTIGIGANTAVFSVVHAVLVKALPYTNPDELVFISEVKSGTTNTANVPPANYFDYRNAKSFSSIGAAEAWGATMTGFDAPEQIRGLRVTASLFDVLGVRPEVGRVFSADEERVGNHRVVVLTHNYWMRRFGGDPAVVGRTIVLGGEPWQVAGVMPKDFRFAPFWVTNAQMFVPLGFRDDQRVSRGLRTLRVFARLKPGVTAEQSAQELASLFDKSAENASLQPWVRPLGEMVVGKVKAPLVVLAGAVGLVLLIGCANVATLLLVRALGHRRELAVRLSLGATRWELMRASLVESALLAGAGAALGLLLASVGIDALAGWFRTSLPRWEEIGINSTVVWFTAGVTVIAALVLSAVSALQVPNLDVYSVLKESARSVGGSVWSGRARRALVVAQVALSLVLLAGAGLLTRSLLAIQAIDPGFRAERVNTGLLHTWGTPVAQPAVQAAFYRSVEERLRAAGPVGMINHLPIAGDMWTLGIRAEGQAEPLPGERMGAAWRTATPGYFETMGIAAVRGRVLADTDVPGAPKVVVVNEALARRVWPREDAVGKHLSVDGGEYLTVCGVVRDVVQLDWMAPRQPEVYLPLAQHPQAIGKPHTSSMTVVSRAAVDLRALVASVNSSVPVTDVQTMDEVVANATRRSRVYASLLGVFAGSAVLLALIGLYGVVSNDVTRRTQEIGVRAAMGARPVDISGMVLRDAMRLTGTGTGIGLACTLAASRLMESMLYGVKPADVTTLAGATALFAAVAILAAGLPARRASRLDPVRALRSE